MCVLIGNNPNLSSLSVTGYLDDRRCEALTKVTLPALQTLTVVIVHDYAHDAEQLEACLVALVRISKCLRGYRSLAGFARFVTRRGPPSPSTARSCVY